MFLVDEICVRRLGAKQICSNDNDRDLWVYLAPRYPSRVARRSYYISIAFPGSSSVPLSYFVSCDSFTVVPDFYSCCKKKIGSELT